MTNKFIDQQSFAKVAPIGRGYRVSSDSVWPLRGADGLTFAERRAQQERRA